MAIALFEVKDARDMRVPQGPAQPGLPLQHPERLLVPRRSGYGELQRHAGILALLLAVPVDGPEQLAGAGEAEPRLTKLVAAYVGTLGT